MISPPPPDRGSDATPCKETPPRYLFWLFDEGRIVTPRRQPVVVRRAPQRGLEDAVSKTAMEPPHGYEPTGKDTGLVKPKGTSKIRAHEGIETLAIRSRKPHWLKVRSPGGPNYLRLQKKMRSAGLHTVCEEASCPNIGECWEAGTATFMILGDVCTRACKYCGVAHGLPTTLDTDEPRRVAQTVRKHGVRARGDHERQSRRVTGRRCGYLCRKRFA